MMYETLARYYDALVKDDEATMAWVKLIKQHIPKGKLLELACGSGEITIALAKDGYEIHASDLSKDMIQTAKAKKDSALVSWRVMDMCQFDVTESYDGILCLCDSFNYLLHTAQVKQLFQDVYAHLKDDGCFLMDMHSLDRLEEFREEYNEVGELEQDAQVQWTILSEEDRIYQNFAFYMPDGSIVLEQHTQRVYDPSWVKEQLEKTGFETTIVTDFDQPGICAGEKQFYICRKVKK